MRFMWISRPSVPCNGQFIGEELVEDYKKNVSAVQKREDTFIGGLSMGGLAHSEMA